MYWVKNDAPPQLILIERSIAWVKSDATTGLPSENVRPERIVIV